MNKTGSYIKAVGGDFGIYFDGSRWVSFECLGCAIAKGLVIPALRLSAADYPSLRKSIGYNYQEKHDKTIHNEWIKNGKPFRKG